MPIYLIANRTDRCVEYLEYPAASLDEALTMAERDGAAEREVMTEDAHEMTNWPEDFGTFKVHDWADQTRCPQCGGVKATPGYGLCDNCTRFK